MTHNRRLYSLTRKNINVYRNEGVMSNEWWHNAVFLLFCLFFWHFGYEFLIPRRRKTFELSVCHSTAMNSHCTRQLCPNDKKKKRKYLLFVYTFSQFRRPKQVLHRLTKWKRIKRINKMIDTSGRKLAAESDLSITTDSAEIEPEWNVEGLGASIHNSYP